MKMARQTLAELHDLTLAVMAKSNTAPEIAQQIADALVAAEADGVSSHGMDRLKAYSDQALSGKVDGQMFPEITRPAAAVIRADARGGFAYPAINGGIDRAAEILPETGMASIAIANSHHSGAIGLHVERLARRGFAAFMCGNGPSGMAPWGGERPLYGTNPIAFACPRQDADPLVLDLALSKVARGKIKLAADRGEAIPEGWAVDSSGQSTTDATAAMDGWLLPIGDAKGAALVMMVEILSALFTGSHFGFEASSFFTPKGDPPLIGQFMMAFDPAPMAGAAIAERMETLMTAITDQPGTRLPGARRFDLRAKAEADGVDIPDALLDDLRRRAEA
jgi:(2R)-3-sulfolactate dehydrogenase (NADP+)